MEEVILSVEINRGVWIVHTVGCGEQMKLGTLRIAGNAAARSWRGDGICGKALAQSGNRRTANGAGKKVSTVHKFELQESRNENVEKEG